MNESRKHQVSLRGSSAKEISRDALLEKVYQEREIRNFNRRATAAALFVQRVWRSYSAKKSVTLQLQQQWITMMNTQSVPITRTEISSNVLRPFLFFVSFLSSRYKRIEAKDADCIKLCIRVVLQSVNSSDPLENFCSMATGTIEEKKIWIYQSKKLILLCLFLLANSDDSVQGVEDVVLLSLAVRVAVVLTDRRCWKSITDCDIQVADGAMKDLIHFLGSKKSGVYDCIRRYISKLECSNFGHSTCPGQTDDRFLIITGAITLALRPFHVVDLEVKDNDSLDTQNAAEGYCVSLLTIPWFAQRLPVVLLPALTHKSVLSPCLRMLLVCKQRILEQISELNQLKITSQSMIMPQIYWLLANIIFLVTGGDNSVPGTGKFAAGLDLASYVRVAVILAEAVLACFEKVGWTRNENQEIEVNADNGINITGTYLGGPDATSESLKKSYVDLLRPVCLQRHLMGLLTVEKVVSSPLTANMPQQYPESVGKCELLDIAYFYSCMLRIFSTINPVLGALPVLNMLSFTPGFLNKLWGEIERSIFSGNMYTDRVNSSSGNNTPITKNDKTMERKQKGFAKKDGGNKWVNVLQRITGNPRTESSNTYSTGRSSFENDEEQSSALWDLEPFREGPGCLSRDISCLLHLFCATYSHLLLVLDDIEFYDKQVPFTLEQQRKIASVLNTLVYNAVSHSKDAQNRPLMDSAVRCLHLLYERDCRHKFCPPALWLSPGRKNRPPVVVAARTHEILSGAVKFDDALPSSSVTSVITIIPHVFPFGERVEMFREFINMDKASWRMAGIDFGHGPGLVDISVRRSHIVEDGFRQLNALGSRLKSGIHVSFVSESGVTEPGLDYGGLSKEFLTDIAKAALSPEYGLFSQTSTSDRLLIPNTAARFLENGIQMIEFLGKIVGKALYEGILLDYSFSHVFVQKLLGRYSFIDELSTLDPELYKNLMYVKHYEGDVKDLSLDFTVTEESLGRRYVIELKPGGKEISVTNENKLQYIHAIADYKLNRQILPFSNAFYRGLSDLISPSWLRLFNAAEFNQLLSGGNHDIDVDDLRKHTRYTGGYTEGSRTVKLFWEVVVGFEPRDRCMLLKFVTSCSRAPLLGFKHLQPAFTIHKVACDVPLWATFGGQDVDRLPSASTCYNTLKLPTYKRASTLREKLLYAINSNAGFELS